MRRPRIRETINDGSDRLRRQLTFDDCEKDVWSDRLWGGPNNCETRLFIDELINIVLPDHKLHVPIASLTTTCVYALRACSYVLTVQYVSITPFVSSREQDFWKCIKLLLASIYEMCPTCHCRPSVIKDQTSSALAISVERALNTVGADSTCSITRITKFFTASKRTIDSLNREMDTIQ